MHRFLYCCPEATRSCCKQQVLNLGPSIVHQELCTYTRGTYVLVWIWLLVSILILGQDAQHTENQDHNNYLTPNHSVSCIFTAHIQTYMMNIHPTHEVSYNFVIHITTHDMFFRPRMSIAAKH